MSLPRSFWLLLLAGLALRCVALNQPLVDAHLIRQCQSAAATRSLLTEPGFPLSANIPWQGDLGTRYVLELPLYNYLVIGMHHLAGQLDLSGKLTSVLLWAVSFICLQLIWRRMLDPRQTLWANALFVIAPLGVFYGQAFMPEMLVQALAFGLILTTLRYRENPTLGRWVAVVAIGLAALLVKLPEVSHLYLIIAVLSFGLAGWRGLLAPRYLIAAVLTAAAVKAWGTYADSVNIKDLPEWTSRQILPDFIGTLGSRFVPKPWAMLALYIGGFIMPGPAAAGVAYGFWVFMRQSRERLLGLWLLSVAAYYLVWFGNGGTSQSYYNLPALAPLCALFGIGVSALLASGKIARWRLAATLAVVIALVLPAVPVLRYLFKQDRQLLAAAAWVRSHTQPGDLILFRPGHRWDLADYYANPVMTYYAGRPTFVCTRLTPEPHRRAALERARYAVVTLPPPPVAGLAAALNGFRGITPLRAEPLDWLESRGFQPTVSNELFLVFERHSTVPPSPPVPELRD